MLTDPLFYALAIPAVVLMGLAKGGFSGVGAMSMPLLALAISPVQAAAILLPILIVQDMVSVWAFRRDWDRGILLVMVPGAIAGIVAGYLLAAKVSATAVLGVLGAISILFALHRLWLSRGGRIAAPANSPGWVGAIFGVIAGFTSQIAHAGGPPFQMWVLPRGLTPASLIGTTAIFFALVNWIKVPAYVALGQFTPTNLLTAGVLMPVAIASTFAGVWLVKRIEAERFYTLIYILMAAVGVQLLWKAIAG
ncbi:sulfite exporter TauE/SafE family protein [Phenylobacterium sp. J367]|uniref:sulfite exporter TauE/SafE family protein n=1 Tax=Phenylobacterium sp. J367 TaxID=2898435 RepID=UPI0021509461|nr:sulfite exporter TauE/SafE family protein [Phenylobacterium sp. J367]MCR5879372.1 sulfite exporter TauE/SafE family protein [Phenylobacterium sp. J367]